MVSAVTAARRRLTFLLRRRVAYVTPPVRARYFGLLRGWLFWQSEESFIDESGSLRRVAERYGARYSASLILKTTVGMFASSSGAISRGPRLNCGNSSW